MTVYGVVPESHSFGSGQYPNTMTLNFCHYEINIMYIYSHLI